MRSHKDLDVRRKAVDLTTEIYNITKEFPKTEVYGMIPQIRRSAISISTNIAEGAARNSKKETELIIAKNIGYVVTDEFFKEIDSIRKMLLGLINTLNRGIKNGR